MEIAIEFKSLKWTLFKNTNTYLQISLLINVFLADWCFKCEEGTSDECSTGEIIERLVNKYLNPQEKQLVKNLSTETELETELEAIHVVCSWIIMEKLKVELKQCKMWTHFTGKLIVPHNSVVDCKKVIIIV